jgi:hypothetical protein
MRSFFLHMMLFVTLAAEGRATDLGDQRIEQLESLLESYIDENSRLRTELEILKSQLDAIQNNNMLRKQADVETCMSNPKKCDDVELCERATYGLVGKKKWKVGSFTLFVDEAKLRDLSCQVAEPSNLEQGPKPASNSGRDGSKNSAVQNLSDLILTASQNLNEESAPLTSNIEGVFNSIFPNLYSRAKTEVSQWPENMPYYEGNTPVGWFDTENDNATSWLLKNCVETQCVSRWYDRRKAFLEWIVVSDHHFGDYGLAQLVSLRADHVLMSYGMATHTRNTIFSFQDFPSGQSNRVLCSTGECHFTEIRNGQIDVNELANSQMKIAESKGYFLNSGGAFWVDLELDAWGRITAMGTTSPYKDCMAKEDFLKKTSSFSRSELERLRSNEVCVAR